jgi:IMP dehydrogenase
VTPRARDRAVAADVPAILHAVRNGDGIALALSYDDVMLVPRRSGIRSRSDVETSTRFTRDIRLRMPVVSANMDTITGANMAIAMARAGAIGVIHRFLSVEDQVGEIVRVKRAEAVVIEDPHAVGPDATLGVVREEAARLGVTGLLVVDSRRRLLGIVTSRDMRLHDDPTLPVDAVMTPRERMVVSGPDTSGDRAARVLREARVEKLPLVDEDDVVVGLVTLRDLIQRADRPEATLDPRGHLAVAAAIGVRGDYLERARALVDARADALVLDIAHGHADHAIEALAAVREAVGDEAQLVAGNVATAEGALDLVKAGADAVKVGVGPGSVCTTRVVAGVGVPQLTAVMECAAVCHEHDVPLIADGGIKAGGDVAKAIGAGAESVMVGNLLAGTPESPGEVVTRDGVRLKVFRGMASGAAAAARRAAEGEDETEFTPVVPEGVEAVAPLRDSAAQVVHELVGGLRSGMSYSDARTIREMNEKARFVRITPAGLRESHPHDVTL